MTEADFTLKLIDEMTRPMHDIVDELRKLRRAFEAVDRRTDDLNKSLKSTGNTAAREGKRVRRLGEDFRAGFQVFTGNLLTAGFFAVTRGIQTMVASSIQAAKDLTMSILDMGIFSDKTEKSFSLIAGSVQEGERAMERVLNLSQDLSLGFTDTALSMQQLMAQSFTLEEATGLIEMVADLKQMGVEGERSQRVLMALTQIRAKGKLQAEEMLQLAEAGIPLAKVREELMGIMNVDLQELEKLQMAGEVKPDAALEAVQRAVNSTLGIARSGDAGREFAKSTIQGALDGFGTARELFLLKVAKDSKSAFNSLAPAINAVSDALTDAGVVENVVQGFKELIEAATDTNTIDSVTDAIKMAASAFRKASEVFSTFMSGFMEVLAPGVAEALESMDKPLSKDAIDGIKNLGEGLGEAAAGALKLADALNTILDIVGFFNKLDDIHRNVIPDSDGLATTLVEGIPGVGQFHKIKRSIGDLFEWIDDPEMYMRNRQARIERSKQMGRDVVEGFKRGMEESKGGLWETVKSVTSSVFDAMASKDGIDAHSPSRKAFKFGEWIDMGIAGGLRESGEAAREAMSLAQDVVSPIMPSRNATGSFAGSPVARGASSSSTNNYNFGGVSASTEVRTDRPEAAAGITQDGLVSAMMQALARSKAAA